MNQEQTPLADALSTNSLEQFIPFDIPGHKGNIIEFSRIAETIRIKEFGEGVHSG